MRKGLFDKVLEKGKGFFKKKKEKSSELAKELNKKVSQNVKEWKSKSVEFVKGKKKKKGKSKEDSERKQKITEILKEFSKYLLDSWQKSSGKEELKELEINPYFKKNAEEEKEDLESPLFIVVVGFHHKLGSTVCSSLFLSSIYID